MKKRNSRDTAMRTRPARPRGASGEEEKVLVFLFRGQIHLP